MVRIAIPPQEGLLEKKSHPRWTCSVTPLLPNLYFASRGPTVMILGDWVVSVRDEDAEAVVVSLSVLDVFFILWDRNCTNTPTWAVNGFF